MSVSDRKPDEPERQADRPGRRTEEPDVEIEAQVGPVTQMLYMVDGRLVNSWGQPVDDRTKVTGRTLGTPPPPPGEPANKRALVVGNGGMAYVNLTEEDMAIINQAQLDVKATIPRNQQAPANVVAAVPEEPKGAQPPELVVNPLTAAEPAPTAAPEPQATSTAARAKRNEA